MHKGIFKGTLSWSRGGFTFFLHHHNAPPGPHCEAIVLENCGRDELSMWSFKSINKGRTLEEVLARVRSSGSGVGCHEIYPVTEIMLELVGERKSSICSRRDFRAEASEGGGLS